MSLKFDLPKQNSSIIKVIGVGGGGSNAVNHMYSQGIKGVDFIVCNTDAQALEISPIPFKIQLGSSLTEGRGAGSKPEVGKNAAIENIDTIKELIANNTQMVFVTAGMGGGTGTGAAPIIAEAARQANVLTVGIVTLPFAFEGKKRRMQAITGIEEMRKQVDTLLIINNEKLREMYGNLDVVEAFAQADNVVTTAAKGIAEIITRTGYINVDFEDVRTVMSDGGVAIMGSATAEGENRAIRAVEHALASPLLNDNNIYGANYVLLNISFGGNKLMMDEITQITDYIQEEAGDNADVIWGYGFDESLGDAISVTVIATGFNTNLETPTSEAERAARPKVHVLKTDEPQQVKTEEKPITPSYAPVLKFDEPEIKKLEEPIAKVEKEDKIVSSILEKEEVKEEPKAPIISTIEFDIKKESEKTAEKEEKQEVKSTEPFLIKRNVETVVDKKEEVVVNTPKAEETNEPSISHEERMKLSAERINRLKTLSERLKSPTGIQDMESEPAFVRRNVNLSATPLSSDSQASRWSVGASKNEDGETKLDIKSNNSYLHDNVD
jgi:cell division protein FtsZ